MFTVQFYTNHSERSKVGKTLTSTTALQGSQKDMDVLDQSKPVLVFTTNPEGNYAFIQELNRYYFIANREWLYNGLIQITFEKDILESKKEEIKRCSGYVTRQENKGNLYLPDDKWPVVNDTLQYTKKLTNGKSFNTTYRIITISSSATKQQASS